MNLKYLIQYKSVIRKKNRLKLAILLFFFSSNYLFAQFTYLPNPLGSSKSASSRIINSMVFDSENRLYAATYWNEDFSHNASSAIGFYTYDGTKWSAKKLNNSPIAWEEYGNVKISPNSKYLAFQNEQNHSYSMGVRLFNIENGGFNEIKVFPDGLPMIESIAFDKDSKLWMLGNGTAYKGSFPNAFTWNENDLEIKSLPLLPTTLTTFSFIGDAIMRLSAGSNYYEYDIDTQKRKEIGGSINWKAFDQTNSKGETYYLNTYKGLEIIRQNSSNRPIDPPEVNKIYQSLLLDDDTFLLATNEGLLIYKNNSWKAFNTANSNLKGNRISALTKDSQGNVWVAGTEENNTKTFIAKFDKL